MAEPTTVTLTFAGRGRECRVVGHVGRDQNKLVGYFVMPSYDRDELVVADGARVRRLKASDYSTFHPVDDEGQALFLAQVRRDIKQLTWRFESTARLHQRMLEAQARIDQAGPEWTEIESYEIDGVERRQYVRIVKGELHVAAIGPGFTPEDISGWSVKKVAEVEAAIKRWPDIESGFEKKRAKLQAIVEKWT